jgi:hypothetical protein
MVKFENFKVHNLETVINGMIDADVSDSKMGIYLTDYADEIIKELSNKYDENHPDPYIEVEDNKTTIVALGASDLNTLRLEAVRGNADYLKYITVTGEIIAPLSWWNEFDRHWVGISEPVETLDKTLAGNAFCLDSFDLDGFVNVPYTAEAEREDLKYPVDPDFIQMVFIPYLNHLRNLWVFEKEKDAFRELKRWLPSSYLQKRRVVTNYAELSILCKSAFTEWSRTMIPLINTLPYLREIMD